MPLVALGAIAIGGSIFGGVMAKKGADAQANAIQSAQDKSVAEQRREYDQSRQDLAPWRNNGGAANNQLAYLLGVGPQYGDGGPTEGTGAYNMLHGSNPNDSLGGYGSLMKDFTGADVQNDPGYQFGLSEGSKALQRSAAAKGQLFSGGTLKSLTQYNNDYATTKFDDANNRFNTNRLNRYNMLSGLSQGGQQATNTTVAAGMNSANNISNTYMNAGAQLGNARASGYAGIGQAVNGGVGSLLDLYAMSQNGKKN